jgi:hypothetical protein
LPREPAQVCIGHSLQMSKVVAPHPAHSACSAFHHRAFTVLSTATVVSNIGGGMYSAASAWLMTTLDPSPVAVSLPLNLAARALERVPHNQTAVRSRSNTSCRKETLPRLPTRTYPEKYRCFAYATQSPPTFARPARPEARFPASNWSTNHGSAPEAFSKSLH